MRQCDSFHLTSHCTNWCTRRPCSKRESLDCLVWLFKCLVIFFADTFPIRPDGGTLEPFAVLLDRQASEYKHPFQINIYQSFINTPPGSSSTCYHSQKAAIIISREDRSTLSTAPASPTIGKAVCQKQRRERSMKTPAESNRSLMLWKIFCCCLIVQVHLINCINARH